VLHEAFDGIFSARFFKIKTSSKIKKKVKNVKNVARIKNVKKRFFTSTIVTIRMYLQRFGCSFE